MPGRKLWPATDNSVRPNGWCSLLVNFRLFCPPEKLVRHSGLLRPRLGRCTPLSPTPLANSDNPHPPLPTQAGRRIFVYRPSLCCHVSSLHPFLHAGLVQGFTSFVKTDSAGQVLSNLGGVSRADFRFDRHYTGSPVHLYGSQGRRFQCEVHRSRPQGPQRHTQRTSFLLFVFGGPCITLLVGFVDTCFV